MTARRDLDAWLEDTEWINDPDTLPGSAVDQMRWTPDLPEELPDQRPFYGTEIGLWNTFIGHGAFDDTRGQYSLRPDPAVEEAQARHVRVMHHIDGNPRNNHPENVRIIDPRENTRTPELTADQTAVVNRLFDALTVWVQRMTRAINELAAVLPKPTGAHYQPSRHPLDERVCPRHGQRYEAGQCRICQRDQRPRRQARNRV